MSGPYRSVTEYFLIGKTLKSHGTGGQLRLLIEDKYKSYLRKGAFIFFELNGSKVPFQILEWNDDNHVVIKLDDISNKRESDQLSGLDCWLSIDEIKPLHRKSPKNIEGKWEHYSIIDNDTANVYEIIRIEEFPQQRMAVVRINEKEILIPLNDQLISTIDREQKIIYMNLPQGLLDL